MSKNMLGEIPLVEYQRLENDVQQKCAGENGALWLSQLKKFARQEMCWIKSEPVNGTFSIKSTNLAEALKEAEVFHKKAFGGLFGKKVSLEKLFVLPETLPWQNVIAVFVPKGADYRACVKAVQKAGKGLAVYEEEDVNNYSNSQVTDIHRLYLIERSERPMKETMNMSPDQLVATKKSFLGLGAYAIAMGNYHEATGKYLDSETWTWFPKDRLSSGGVARGCWSPDYSKVRFNWHGAGRCDSDTGARLAIEVPLKP